MTSSIDAIPAEELGRVETGTVSARPFRVGGMGWIRDLPRMGGDFTA